MLEGKPREFLEWQLVENQLLDQNDRQNNMKYNRKENTERRRTSIDLKQHLKLWTEGKCEEH